MAVNSLNILIIQAKSGRFVTNFFDEHTIMRLLTIKRRETRAKNLCSI